MGRLPCFLIFRGSSQIERQITIFGALSLRLRKKNPRIKTGRHSSLVGVPMLTKCLNPSCVNQFRYLHEGRLFPAPATDHVGCELWWLCDVCCRSMTVRVRDGKAELEPIPPLPQPRLTCAVGKCTHPVVMHCVNCRRTVCADHARECQWDCEVLCTICYAPLVPGKKLCHISAVEDTVPRYTIQK